MITKIGSIILALVLVLTAALTFSLPAKAAYDLSTLLQYFDIKYSASFSSTVISGSQPFTLTITATATCKQDLESPFNLITAVKMSGHVIGRNNSTGTTVELSPASNPLYTLNITQFPKTRGASYSDSESMTLQFPGGSPNGTYSIIGEPGPNGGAWVYVGPLEFNVTSYLPTSQQLTNTITYNAAPSYSGGGVITTPTPIASPTPSSTPSPTVIPIIDVTGKSLAPYLVNDKLTGTVKTLSPDSKGQLIINKDTKVIFPPGSTPVITMTPGANPAPPANNIKILGQVYEVNPSGTTFDPALAITISYDPNSIPAGSLEKDIVISFWNQVTSAWEDLKCTVDLKNHTVTALINHFSYYGVIARLPAAASPTVMPVITPTTPPPSSTSAVKPSASPTVTPSQAAVTIAPTTATNTPPPVAASPGFFNNIWMLIGLIAVVVVLGLVIGVFLSRRRS